MNKRVLIVILCLLYVVLPLDVLPDVLPVIGWVDDLAAIVFGAMTLLRGGQDGPPDGGSGGLVATTVEQKG